MSRELDGGREPRQAPDRGKAGKSADPLHFEEGREESPLEPRPPAKGARGGKQAELLRFGPGPAAALIGKTGPGRKGQALNFFGSQTYIHRLYLTFNITDPRSALVILAQRTCHKGKNSGIWKNFPIQTGP